MSDKARLKPIATARLAGVFYLLVIVTAPLSMIIRNRLIVSGDASASAASLLAHEPLYRFATAADMIGVVFDVAALTILNATPHPVSLAGPQLNELALLVVRFGGQAVNVGIVFFGCYCLSIGWLIVKSRFIPAIFGVGMIIAGLGWVSFIYQLIAAALNPFNMISGLGEVALTAWLLIIGLDARRWTGQADGAGNESKPSLT